jgi:hypothetical protein
MFQPDQAPQEAPEISAVNPPESTPFRAEAPLARPGGRIRRTFDRITRGLDWAFGLLCLVAGLAIFSVVPLLNFISLGYLLHVSARVARSGRIRDGFPGVRRASRIGSFVVGALLISIPARILSSLWKDAEIVAPGSSGAALWRIATFLVTSVTLFQILWASLRGGRLHHFLWPAPLQFIAWLKSPDKVSSLRDRLSAGAAGLRLPFLFWLGARAFAGTFLWLLLPVGILIAAAQQAPESGGAILSLLGGLLLMPVVLYLPFLQVRFALEDRFRALFEIGSIRQHFNRAPLAFWCALLATLLFALPLYLLKIELPPRGIVWLPSLVFVLFIFPARLLTGWAFGRALRQSSPRHGLIRWASRLGLIPVVLLYVVIVYLSQYLSWNGTLGLLEQHAFLVPAPWASL